MNSEQMKRLKALEAADRVQRIEESFERDRSLYRDRAEELAETLDMSPDMVLEELRREMIRLEEIGEEAYLRELAAERGLSEEEIRDPEALQRHIDRLDRELEEWRERRRQQEAERVWWQGGVMYRGGVPVTD